MTVQTFDYERYAEAQRIKRYNDLRATRFILLSRLRKAGIIEITGTYDGYGDSGNIEDVSLFHHQTRAPVIATDDLVREIGDFIWGLAYAIHPGFENNEGGGGELIWDLDTDRICLDHSDRYIETNQTVHEGI